MGCQPSPETAKREPAFKLLNLNRDGMRQGTLAGSLLLEDEYGESIPLDPAHTELEVTFENADGRWEQVKHALLDASGKRALDVSLVADNSGSQKGQLRIMQTAARKFAKALYARGSDTRVGLVRVSTASEVVQELTPSPVQFDAAIDQLYVRNGWTALFDGVRMGNEVLENGVVSGPPLSLDACVDQSLRGIVAFTDGRDNNSDEHKLMPEMSDEIDTGLGDVADLKVLASPTPVFWVAVGPKVDLPKLEKMATATEGQVLSVADFDGLDAALLKVAARLSHAVPVCFRLPSAGAKRVRIRIQTEHEGAHYDIVRELSVPSDDCARPFRPARVEWTPEGGPLSCPRTLNGGTAKLEQLVHLADAGCIKGSSGEDPSGSYAPPTEEERAELERIMPDFFAALGDARQSLTGFERAFRSMGLTLSEFNVGTDRIVVLLETGPQLRGAGGYIFRRGPVTHEMILQAPHSFHEPHSLPIMRRIMAAHSMRGLFFNTLHRHYLLPREICGQAYPADVAHVTGSFFHALTTGYLTQFDRGTVVQLHGYTQIDPSSVEVILSSGTLSPSDQVQRIAARLEAELGDPQVALFPREIHRYGATFNAQGRWVEEFERGHFVHVELSSALATRLRNDDGVARSVAAALISVD